MPQTYEPIATTTLSSTSNTITFTSVPNTYTDLRLVLVGEATATGQFFGMTFNGDDATGNTSNWAIDGNGTSVTKSGLVDNSYGGGLFYNVDMSATYLSFTSVDIFNYNSAIYKSYIGTYSGDQNGADSYVARAIGTWANTAAITQVRARLGTTGLFAVGTIATLFGIKAA